MRMVPRRKKTFINGNSHVKKATISSRFIKYFIILLLIPFLLGSMLIYIIQSNASKRNAIMLYSDINARVNLNMDMTFQKIENAANEMAFSSLTQKALEKYNQNGNPQTIDQLLSIKDLLVDSEIKSNFLIKNAVLFSNDGKYFNDIGFYKENHSIYNYSYFKKLSESHGENIWISSHIDNYDPMTGSQNVITLAKKILLVSGHDMADTIGYLIINIRENDLNKLMYTYGNNSENIIMVSPSAGIISHSDKKLIGTPFDLTPAKGNSSGTYFNIIDNKECLVTYSKLQKTGWYLIAAIDSAAILRESRNLMYLTVTVTVVLFLFFILIILLLSKRISKPIKNLSRQMRKVENGDFNISFNENADILEVDNLTKGFNVMVYKLNNLINDVYNAEIKEKQLEAAVKQAELEALQQQINPHFLYNTLDCINWMASLEGNDSVSNMVMALGNYFRSSVHRGKNFVTVEAEVQNIKDYLYIQSMRSGFRFKSEINVEPDMLKCFTMKLLLQPIVENAIVHGLEPKHSSGTIKIDIYKKNEHIEFCIEDDGVGMSKTELDSFLKSLTEKVKNSIGLRNVLERLTLYFGENHTYSIQSQEGKGTKIVITIPCIYTEEELHNIIQS